MKTSGHLFSHVFKHGSLLHVTCVSAHTSQDSRHARETVKEALCIVECDVLGMCNEFVVSET